jgi:hypothetical protein
VVTIVSFEREQAARPNAQTPKMAIKNLFIEVKTQGIDSTD